MASVESLEFVRAALAELPPAESVLRLAPLDLEPRALVQLTVFTRHLCRDAVLRSASLPARPEWSVLARQADEVVRTDLATVEAIAEWLDGIEDTATVYAFLLCRHVLVALGAELTRRRADGAELAAAYQAIRYDGGHGPLAVVMRALRLRPGPDRDEAGANALALLVEALEGVGHGGDDYATWATASPFRSLRPPQPRWDRAAGHHLDWEMRYALSAPPSALLAAHIPGEAARAEETRQRRERDQRVILRRGPADVAQEGILAEPRSAPPDGVLEQRHAQGAKDMRARQVEALLRGYKPAERQALRAMLGGATDEDAAKRGRLTLRTYQRQKRKFLTQISELPPT